VGGSSETVSAAEGRRDPGVVLNDRGAAVRRESREPASDSGASDVASAFFRRLRRFVGHGARKRRADAARNRQNRGGSLVSLDLDGVRDDRAAIGVRRTRPGADIRCDRQREMTLRIGHLQLIVFLIDGVLILIA